MDKPFVKITLNCRKGETSIVEKWPLNSKTQESDPSRVAIEFNGISYSFVLDPAYPRVECWSLTPKGHIDKMIAVQSLTNSENLSLNRAS